MITLAKTHIKISAAAVGFLLGSFATSALADNASLVASCNLEDDFASLVRAEVAGKSDAEIADLVIAMADAANEPRDGRCGCSALAGGIRAAADGVSDTDQQRRIYRVAGSLCIDPLTTSSVDDDGGKSASPN